MVELKKQIREYLPKDDYPNIDYDKIDNKLDKCVNKKLNENDIKEIKDYVFKNKDFVPPDKDPELFPAFDKNVKEWGKLVDGKIDKDAEVYLKHELSEMKIKEVVDYQDYSGLERKFYHEDIHDAVLEIFDTQK